MKLFISTIILLLSVTGLCIWDGIHTTQIFDEMESESKSIYTTLLSTDITDEEITNRIWKLNAYWTEKMDMLCISISRKDLQPVSDYLQYLCASTINDSQEDAITYSRLLMYNVLGLKETTGIEILNLL